MTAIKVTSEGGLFDFACGLGEFSEPAPGEHIPVYVRADGAVTSQPRGAPIGFVRSLVPDGVRVAVIALSSDEPNADEPNADEPNADEPNADEPYNHWCAKPCGVPGCRGAANRAPVPYTDLAAHEARDEEGSRLSCDIRWVPSCRCNLECGSSCILAKGHDGGCECAGDDPGEPGTCPA